MFIVQYLIYFTIIWVVILITTPRVFGKHHEAGKHEDIFRRNDTLERILEEYKSKSKLRNEIKKKLLKISADEMAKQSRQLNRKLMDHPLYTSSKRVAVYIGTRYEVQTFDVIEDIFKTGRQCFVPKYDRHGDVSMVKLESVAELEGMPKNKWNVSQPADGDVREDALDTGGLDLIIVPGVGFTKGGKRLGRGRDGYDRYLEEYDKKFPGNYCMFVTMAFMEQLCHDIPTAPHDQYINYVVNYEDY